MTESYLGLDAGTSGLKAALWSADGSLLAEAESNYAVDRPRSGWSQSDPQVWVDALDDAIDSLAPHLRQHRVNAIGMAGQMHGLVLADERGKALGPALLWSDKRASEQLGRWRDLPQRDRALLANPLVAGMTGPLLAWTLQHEPQMAQRAAYALLPKDVLRSALVPSSVTDRSDASSTLMWAIAADDWAGGAIERLGLPTRLLPRVCRSSRVVGHTDSLQRVGGSANVPVVAGAADAPAAVLGNGNAEALQINLGSGGQVIAQVPRPWVDANPSAHLYADTGLGWYAMTALQSGGLALDWAARMLQMSWEELFAAAESVAPGAEGVTFLPFVEGERGAIAAPTARAGWFGAEVSTSRPHLARAAIEGVAFALRRAVDLLPQSEAHTSMGTPIALTGGGLRAPVLRQALADLLDCPVQRREVRSASATGAAMLAAEGVGAVLDPTREQGSITEPGTAREPLLDSYARWTSLVEHVAL